jgi:hypothetical protein
MLLKMFNQQLSSCRHSKRNCGSKSGPFVLFKMASLLRIQKEHLIIVNVDVPTDFNTMPTKQLEKEREHGDK